jgi:hypothetical protein
VNEYEFTVTFTLRSPGVDVDDLVERLGDAGCEDAALGVGQRGRVALSFIREAESAAKAVFSGIANVKRAIPDATLIEASPDLVGLTDVAELLHVTRQNVRKLILDCEALAPAPVHEGRPTIWHLAKVLGWLREEKNYSIEEDLAELAYTTMQINLAVRSKDTDHAAQSEILALLA